jgi:2-oxoglutarate dehydrogenase E1 component
LPSDWIFHPTVKKIYEARKKSIQEGKSIDWGTAESLAFASLIQEGFHVRMSG